MSFLINPIRDSRYVLRHNYLIANGESGGLRVSSGTGASIGGLAGAALNGYIGMSSAISGTTSTGRAALVTGRSIIAPRDSRIIYQAVVTIPTQSTSAEEFDYYFGLHDGDGTNTTCVDGLFALYGRNISANWLFVASNNSTQTLHDSGMAVSISLNYHLCVETDPDLGMYHFYMANGSTIAEKHESINMPSSGRYTGISHGIFKAVGTTSRSVSLYRMSYYQAIQGSDPQ